jgi:hypothetical protein
VPAIQLGEYAGLGRRRREELAIAALVLHSGSDIGSEIRSEVDSTRTMPRIEHAVTGGRRG